MPGYVICNVYVYYVIHTAMYVYYVRMYNNSDRDHDSDSDHEPHCD